MADIAHLIGSDLTIGPTGDLGTADSSLWTQQRILRRLITNAGGYIWQLTYGAGLPALVGSTVSAQQIAAIIRQQLALEAAVSTQPEPTILVESDQNGEVFTTITYQDVQTGTSQTLLVPGTS